ncbi:TPA: hypothetical protein MJG48_21400 [Klebsiella pneumoniae]|uniref:right-handed parallel beta-helix repeat-containing protein n=3 Tax=Klebsiella TaxID=570 RepID=UPI0027E9025A|nr:MULTISPECIES: right-handed parallel beta-helix repeat-containing protein [Klebsiella]HBX3783019.1 hypothetical protein [Klebsiella pneumoniae subsp. pneumoniae]EKW0008615.1 right-handed parallel beta-helix repeat-containing protein [Klebsiella pneumoniae]ELA0823312.1 right-handed parallel beta-helix repeat-containing protein [Klebsiella pneumoniae]MEC5754520.1 right-handed parallel beta-helix repeat-containing protein [Klebsiella pneumoniae]HBR5859627.1 right-handed parallel beta-helix repe
MAELNPPLGTTTPEIFLDNVKRADELVNGPAGTVNDRGGEPLDTWRQMMAKNDEVRQNIIPLSKQYMTLSAAQADIANIPEGSTVYVRGPNASILALEYMNVSGTLTPTGRRMDGHQDVLDIKESFPSATWLDHYSISGDSTQPTVTVRNEESVTGTCVLIKVDPNTTVYIGMPNGSYDRFRLLDLPGRPYNGMSRAGSRYSYNGTNDNTGNFAVTFNGVQYACKSYTTASDAEYILLYQSLNGGHIPVIFSLNSDTGYAALSQYSGYQVQNDLTFTPETLKGIEDSLDIVRGEGIVLLGNDTSSTKMEGYQFEVEGSTGRGALLTGSAYGTNIATWVSAVAPNKRYTVIAKIDPVSTRFRIGAFTDIPVRRSIVNRMFVGLDGTLTRQTYKEANGVTYSYVTFDTLSDALGTDNYLGMNLTDTNFDVRFALVEGDFVPGLTYKAIEEAAVYGVPVTTPILKADHIESKMIKLGKNLFNGQYIYGYSPNTSGNIPGEYSVYLNSSRLPTDPAYKDVVALIIPCLPDTKYAISRKGGSRFWVGSAKNMPTTASNNTYASPMKTLVNDDALNSAIIETGADDRFLFVYLSNTGGVVWAQVEKGDKVTSPETYGYMFSPTAQAISDAITSGGGYLEAGVGDGVTDDSDTLQTAINLTTGAISFNPAKTYYISKTLNVNASQAKSLLGNRATFIVDGDYKAFYVKGSMTSGSANPATNGALARAEGGFLIDSLRIYSRGLVTGVGLSLSGMFKPRIVNCDIMYLKNGIQFSDMNRDVVISRNHIYACHDYGLYFDDSADIHQLNVLENIITYCTRNIYLDNADIYNLQIAGNDIEMGTYPPGVAAADKADIWVNAKTSLVEDVSIVGNTLEDHWTANRLVKFDGLGVNSILSVVVSGNSSGNSIYQEIEIGGISGVDITGQFKKSGGSTLGFTGPVDGLHMCVQANKQGGFGGLVSSDGPYNLSNISIEGCQMNGAGAYKAIRIIGKPIIKNMKIHGNNIYDNDVTPSIYIDAASVKGMRVDFNQIDNSFDPSVTQAIVINADSVSGKNSMMFNSATTGAFVAPDGFNVQGNF